MKKSVLAVIGLFLIIYLLPLGVRPLIIPDETRYGEIPREMIASGDWVVPRLDGLRYFEKPVMGYWLNAVSLLVFGENAFAVRFPSTLAAGLSALMLFYLVRKYGQGETGGLFTAAIFLTCLLVAAMGTFSVLDNVLAMLLTGTMFFFFLSYMASRPGSRNRLLALSGACAGLAFLTKGFLAFAVPVVALLPWVIWEGRLRDFLRRCWIPILAAILVSLPWAVMIHLKEPDYWNYFFWNEHVRRFMADNAQHKESFFFYLLLLPGVALPWTFLWPAMGLGLKQINLKTPLTRLAVCWLFFPLLFFSASSGKLPTYILPCFPPLALLMALGLERYLAAGWTRAFNRGAWALAGLMLLAALAFAVLQVTGLQGVKLYAQVWKALLAAAGLVSWALVSFYSARASGAFRKVLLFALAPAALLVLVSFALPDSLVAAKAPGAFLLKYADRIPENSILISDEEPLRAVCWYYKRTDVFLVGSADELAYGLSYPEAKHRRVDPDRLGQMIVEGQARGPVTLVCGTRNYEKWKKNLPQPKFMDTSGEDAFVVAQY